MSDEPMRMDAYYYGFYPTGCQKVDIILSAVACAGKAYHHTQDWGEQTTPPPHLTGESPVDWIQNAARTTMHFPNAKRDLSLPERDRPGILITPAMIDAGVDRLSDFRLTENWAEIVEAVYLAMQIEAQHMECALTSNSSM